MAEWWNGGMGEWQTEWRNGGMADGMTGWRNGRIAECRDGGMAEWQNGRMAVRVTTIMSTLTMATTMKKNPVRKAQINSKIMLVMLLN